MTTGDHLKLNRDEPPSAREEVLLGRVTDGEASPGDWAEIESIASRDPAVWQRLALAQRTHARLESAVEDRIAMSELVDIPRGTMGSVRVMSVRWREYGGWAAAAAVALAWLAVHRGPQPAAPPAGMQAGLVPSGGGAPMTYDDARDQFVRLGRQSGRVVGELPGIFVDASQIPNADRTAVYIVRPILERLEATDAQVWRTSTDEQGLPVHLPAGGIDQLKTIGTRPD